MGAQNCYRVDMTKTLFTLAAPGTDFAIWDLGCDVHLHSHILFIDVKGFPSKVGVWVSELSIEYNRNVNI